MTTCLSQWHISCINFPLFCGFQHQLWKPPSHFIVRQFSLRLIFIPIGYWTTCDYLNSSFSCHMHFKYSLWPSCVADVDIIFCSCSYYLLLSFFFSSPILSGRRLDVYHTSTHGVALVRITMQVWNVLHAAHWKYRTPKKSPKIRHLGTITQLCRAISSQLRHVSTIRKKSLNINISSTCHIWWTSAD